MNKRIVFAMALAWVSVVFSGVAQAGVDGSVSGSLTDPQGIAIPNMTVKLLNSQGATVKEVATSATGDFQFFPVIFGDYGLAVESPDFAPYHASIHVGSGGNTQADIHLELKVTGKEMVLEVKAKKHLIQNSAATSSTEVSQEEIRTLPGGDEISLPKLLTTTTPGVVAGPFGQMFFRGNHANIQYQIDGIQLPDSPSNTFGEAFSPRNIDHMEVITGGIPSEYGERLASVVNIVTKSGPETPGGEVELNYGSYNTFSPHLMYGGSNTSGSIHYFLSANYNRTDRGLDTPQPASDGGLTGLGLNQGQGGKEAVHDSAYGNNEFGKLDWLMNNDDKLSFIFFNSYHSYQIPNYPANYLFSDHYYSSGFTDTFGNQASSGPTFNWVPFNTNDTQREQNLYFETVWKHTYSERSFLQLAPYWKYSELRVDNDPLNDLTTGIGTSPFFIAGATPSTFTENRHTNNFGLKADFSTRPDDRNLVKAGFQTQWSRSNGVVSVQTTDGNGNLNTPSIDGNPDTGLSEALYLQDDYVISKPLTLNIGIRFDATQYHFSDASPTDDYFQPRVGLNYMATETTKLHAFYGKLFMPAPVEDLRDTFASSGAGQFLPYDIKAEKDDYYEIGAAQQFLDQHVVSLNIYYKHATNMLDESQLLNTSIAQPYNFTKGYAYGAELSLKGQIDAHWSEYLNYSYEIAKGQGISGGLFAFQQSTSATAPYQFLDHVQVHTANSGVTYAKDHFWGTIQELYGSGLRTGPSNSLSLPQHFSTDLTLGYEFHSESWWSQFKLSGDAINVFDNVYPITIANGYNGSHYAAGREFFIRLTKEL